MLAVDMLETGANDSCNSVKDSLGHGILARIIGGHFSFLSWLLF
jgi:hypothetical protein